MRGAGAQTVSGIDFTAYPGLTANAATAARNLLTDLTASVGTINQSFGIKSATDTTLKGSPEIPAKYFRQVQREVSAYFKDEWKFRPDLTLNGPYGMCAKCHDLGNVVSDVSFSQHSRHISQDGFSCSVCHTPHGMGAISAGVKRRSQSTAFRSIQ